MFSNKEDQLNKQALFNKKMTKTNYLEYSVTLRKEGHSSNEIKLQLKETGLDKSQIEYYIKKSDNLFLNQLISNKNTKKKSKKSFKSIALFFSLLLLLTVFFGYARIGLLGLFIIWSVLGFGSYRK